MLTFWWSLWPAVHTAPISNQAIAKPAHMIKILSSCIIASELSRENPMNRTSIKLTKIWKANAKEMLEPVTQKSNNRLRTVKMVAINNTYQQTALQCLIAATLFCTLNRPRLVFLYTCHSRCAQLSTIKCNFVNHYPFSTKRNYF